MTSRSSTRSLSRQRTPTRRPTHSTRLPAELIFAIFDVAVNSPARNASAEAAASQRAALLARLSLVCKATQRWAQHKLYTHPVLRQGHVNPFVKSVTRNAALAAKVRKVTLVGSGTCTPATSDDEDEDDEVEGAGYEAARSMHHLGRLKRLFRLCGGLVGVELCGVVCRSLTDLDGAERE